MEQTISVAGALLILAAFAGIQFGYIDRTRSLYNWMNLLGAAALTVIAFRAGQWGFVLLEGVWAVVSAWPLLFKRGTNSAKSC